MSRTEVLGSLVQNLDGHEDIMQEAKWILETVVLVLPQNRL